MAQKGGLGKGLDALFLENISESGAGVSNLRISEIEPNKSQPRRNFDEAALNELADSIKEHGVLQPIVVRPIDSGGYQIVAGERRWRASRLAGLIEIPAIIRAADDSLTMEIALIENLQREDLNAIEEAQGYKTLIDLYNMTQDQVAKRVGKSRPVIANALRLLSLPFPTIEALAQGDITPGHARVLAGLSDPAEIGALTRRIITEGLSVRMVERIAKGEKEKKAIEKGAATPVASDPSSWGESYYKEVELALQNTLGRRIKIFPQTNGGQLQVEFFSKEDLGYLASVLSGEKGHW